MYKIILVLIFFLFNSIYSQYYKIISSDEKSITVIVDFNNSFSLKDTLVDNKVFTKIYGNSQFNRNEGEPFLPEYYISLGIPFSSSPKITILSVEQELLNNKFIFPTPNFDENGNIISITDFNQKIYSNNSFFPVGDVELKADYVARFAKIKNVLISPFRFNPVKRELIYNKKIKFRVDYNETDNSNFILVNDSKTDEFIKTSVINYEHARNWTGKEKRLTENSKSNSSWYNPNKEYFKIYLNKKGIYRVKYEDLIAAGLSESALIKSKKIELFCDGVEIPVDIFRDKDSVFSTGSYFQFVGYPPTPTPYSKLNIYNLTNVYWFSYEADTSGQRYKNVDGKPLVWSHNFFTNKRTLHYERDTIYERLGYAENSNRDYWFWGKASGDAGVAQEAFFYTFPTLPALSADSVYVTVRVGLHGLTVGQHQADIQLTSQPLGSKIWSGQREAVFETTFKIGDIYIYPVNTFQVLARGEFERDEIRINWFEFEFWQNNYVFSDNYIFTSPKNIYGKTKLMLERWTADTMLVYIPQRGEIIRNASVTHNTWDVVEFVDQLFVPTEYFCASLEHFLSPDSIVKNINSDLQNLNNKADYIIITHPKFLSVANRLAEHRRTNLSGFNNPSVSVVNVFDIYNEFSGGLLNPFAIKDFLEYAYQNWTAPAPSYVVLLGDMSYDYRGIFPSSRKNYIPSIPYQSYKYGQAVSDEMFAAVNGSDLMPDISLGRLSCETVEEGNILIDKIIAYPSDKSKLWRQNALLYSAGQNNSDENYFRFNDESLALESNFINPQGFSTYKVFTFQNKPTHIPFLGGTTQMIDGFNSGGVITNFFGHGGGYQWDLFFLNDHIYQLENAGRQPFITSITCYTAHFDNQDVFGEQFIKVPGKGAIGFWGHTGITFWAQGKALNTKLYQQIFNNKVYVIGDAIRFAKSSYPNGMTSLEADHVALLTLLGDPALELAFVKKPDFQIESSDISFYPEAPLVDEEVNIKVKINNIGVAFPGDSVSVKVFIASADTSLELIPKYLQSFGERDSLNFIWKPERSGLFSVKIEVNGVNVIEEEDYSDNMAEKTLPVYNVKETNIISPLNGITTNEKRIKFVLADPSIYIGKSYSFFIEIDTSISFSNPLLSSPELFGTNGIAEWNPTIDLANGYYFWRARVRDLDQAPIWSKIFTFEVTSQTDSNNFVLSDKQLKLFKTNNLFYSDISKSLQLNMEKLPPRPSNSKFIEDIFPDSVATLEHYSAFTTDGTYLYVAHMAYYIGATNIYKFGTGFNGTEKGVYYGMVPSDTVRIWSSMFYYGNKIYIATGDPYHLKEIDPITGAIRSVAIPSGLLDVYACKVQNGSFYVKSDGTYIYNLTVVDSLGESRYTLRMFDPNDNFRKINDDIVFTGTSYPSFTDFFVSSGYVYPYERNISGFMRRLNIKTGEFEDTDWLPYVPYQGYFAWTYDYLNDVVYGSVFQTGKKPKFSKFMGTYYQTYGTATSPEVTNVKKWKSAEYNILADGSSGTYKATLEGFDKNSNGWAVLKDSVNSLVSLEDINPNIYQSLRFHFFFSDSSQNSTVPLQIKNIKFKYVGLPDIQVSNASLSFDPDSLMQGFPIAMSMSVKNYGHSTADSAVFTFKLNEQSQPFLVKNVAIPSDSTFKLNYNINTTPLLFSNKVKLECVIKEKELFAFNNVGSKSFYVNRDSLNPTFEIKFDGEEILNGDIISSKPLILMTLKDNSPLPLDSTYFYVYHNNIQVERDSLVFAYTPYPNSTAYLTWNPTLRDGTHYLEVLARDASLNYFDTTTYKIWFNVNNKNEIRDVYNYPNPFSDGTYFTFNLTGSEKPEEIRIKVFTIAGRLIKDLEIPIEPLKFGFNKFYWNGKDEDGDEIGNGVYFYKILTTKNGVTTTETKKIAKVK